MAKPRDLIPDDANPDDVGDEWASEETDEKLSLICVSPRIDSKEKALKYYDIDEKKWQIDKIQIRHYEMGSKVEAVQGGLKITRAMAVVPLHGIFIQCSPRTGWDVEEFRALVMDDFKKAPPKLRKAPKVSGAERLAEIAIYDAHIGKLAWKHEVGESYDVDIARARYLDCFDQLLSDVSAFRPDKYLFVVGNDFLHTDVQGQTTKGTSLADSTDGRWQRSFLVAQRLTIDCITRLRDLAPVDVLVIPGNHDEQSMFTLGCSIECYFHNDESVFVDNSPCLQKAYVWGKSFIGLEHGQGICSAVKIKQVPQTYMNRFASQWAACDHHYVHFGHVHHRSIITVGDTIIQSIPSISSNDLWHHSKNYIAPIACEAHLYDLRSGRGFFSYSPEKNME